MPESPWGGEKRRVTDGRLGSADILTYQRMSSFGPYPARDTVNLSRGQPSLITKHHIIWTDLSRAGYGPNEDMP
ncbi:hypothetical protein T265_02730 [Opisthorchis viverrini]|uniref:Uncharacterized protein n=1 Tax=Opisthorchis viverrini TaxID=6198 RepID=A0A074ZY54_OPIVI|nr:hypothetical protein T265_02730 [Opisthorchis viverrini]KER30917.1 hypothetical protein T265_02730 [Opisthorchis viverrini]